MGDSSYFPRVKLPSQHELIIINLIQHSRLVSNRARPNCETVKCVGIAEVRQTDRATSHDIVPAIQFRSGLFVSLIDVYFNINDTMSQLKFKKI